MINADNIITILNLALAAIGLATIGLRVIAPITKTKVDNKILKYLIVILEKVSLNMDTKELKILIK